MTWLIKQCMVVYWGYYSINSSTGIYLYIIYRHCEIISNQVEAAISSKKKQFLYESIKNYDLFLKKKSTLSTVL